VGRAVSASRRFHGPLLPRAGGNTLRRVGSCTVQDMACRNIPSCGLPTRGLPTHTCLLAYWYNALLRCLATLCLPAWRPLTLRLPGARFCARFSAFDSLLRLFVVGTMPHLGAWFVAANAFHVMDALFACRSFSTRLTLPGSHLITVQDGRVLVATCNRRARGPCLDVCCVSVHTTRRVL